MKKQHMSKPMLHLTKICGILLAVYATLAVVVYFLMGYQLHYRESRGNLPMPDAEEGTVELMQGSSVIQDFSVSIQRLTTVSVKWSTYYRVNTGIVRMELFDLQNNTLLMQKDFDTAKIAEGGVTTLKAETPIETVYEVPLRLVLTADSPAGETVTPLIYASMNSIDANKNASDFALYLNNIPTEGTLCFSVSGEDYIWTGLHYWQLTLALGLVMVAYFFSAYCRWRHGKKSLLVNAVISVRKYRFLIKQLVSRDFKTKYKRSVLGVFWSFLNPLLTMIVQYMVFSNLFRFDLPHYQVYLLCGIILFNFFSEACAMTLSSIVGNASLITKVYVPKYVYPLTRVLSSLVNFLIALIPLFAVALFAGLQPTKAWLLFPYVLVCLTVFTLGMGMLLATAMVFFRDIQFLWGVLSMIWMYLTPTFYPASILPDTIAWVLKINPLYYYVTFARSLILDGISPEPIIYFICAAFSLGMLMIGAAVFKKNQDMFVLYL